MNDPDWIEITILLQGNFTSVFSFGGVASPFKVQRSNVVIQSKQDNQAPHPTISHLETDCSNSTAASFVGQWLLFGPGCFSSSSSSLKTNWNWAYSQFLPGYNFFKNICRILASVYLFQLQLSIFQYWPYEMVLEMYVFSPGMKCWVICKMNSTLAITV